MRIPLTMLVVIIGGVVFLSGCGKKEADTAGPAEATPEAVTTSAVEQVTATATGQTQVVEEAAKEAVTNAPAPGSSVAPKVPAPAAGNVQSIIDQAKKYIGEKKWPEAIALLNQLSGQTLTAEQSAVVQSLKEQIQKATESAGKTEAATAATNVVGGLLPSKK